jgi:hypothetical protein
MENMVHRYHEPSDPSEMAAKFCYYIYEPVTKNMFQFTLNMSGVTENYDRAMFDELTQGLSVGSESKFANFYHLYFVHYFKLDAIMEHLKKNKQ